MPSAGEKCRDQRREYKQSRRDCVSELQRTSASKFEDGSFAANHTGKMWGKKVSAIPGVGPVVALTYRAADFVAADMPNANRLTLGIMAMVAEEERRMISTRTKDAWRRPRGAARSLVAIRGVVPSKRVRAML